MTSSLPDFIGVFDRAADTYDRVATPFFGPAAKGLIDELGVQPGHRALDLGCGRGAALLPLARAVGGTGSVLGIDLAPRMVQLAGDEVRDYPQAEVRLGDAANPGLPPASRDVIVSTMVLHMLPDPAQAVRTWTDLLVRGGWLGVSMFGATDAARARLQEVWEPFLPPALRPSRRRDQGPFSSDEGVERLLREAGLTDVRTVHRRFEVVYRDADQLIEVSWSTGQRALWEAIPQQDHPVISERVRHVFAELVGGPGPLRTEEDVRYTLGRRP